MVFRAVCGLMGFLLVQCGMAMAVPAMQARAEIMVTSHVLQGGTVPVTVQVSAGANSYMPSTVTLHCSQGKFAKTEATSCTLSLYGGFAFTDLSLQDVGAAASRFVHLWATVDGAEVGSARVTVQVPREWRVIEKPAEVAVGRIVAPGRVLRALLLDDAGEPIAGTPCVLCCDMPTGRKDVIAGETDQRGVAMFSVPASDTEGPATLQVLAGEAVSQLVSVQYITTDEDDGGLSALLVLPHEVNLSAGNTVPVVVAISRLGGDPMPETVVLQTTWGTFTESGGKEVAVQLTDGVAYGHLRFSSNVTFGNPVKVLAYVPTGDGKRKIIGIGDCLLLVERDMDLRLLPGAPSPGGMAGAPSLQVRVVDAGGLPLRGVPMRVSFQFQRTNPTLMTGETDASGVATLTLPVVTTPGLGFLQVRTRSAGSNIVVEFGDGGRLVGWGTQLGREGKPVYNQTYRYDGERLTAIETAR